MRVTAGDLLPTSLMSFPSGWTGIYLSICLSVYLSISLSLYLSILHSGKNCRHVLIKWRAGRETCRLSLYIFAGVDYQDYFCATCPDCTANLIIVSSLEGKTDCSSSSVSCVSILQSLPCSMQASSSLSFVLWKLKQWSFEKDCTDLDVFPVSSINSSLGVCPPHWLCYLEGSCTGVSKDHHQTRDGARFKALSKPKVWVFRRLEYLTGDMPCFYTRIPIPKHSRTTGLSGLKFVVKKVICASCFVQPQSHHRPTPGPLQITYRANRSVKNVVTMALPVILQHLWGFSIRTFGWVKPCRAYLQLCKVVPSRPRWKWGTTHREYVRLLIWPLVTALISLPLLYVTDSRSALTDTPFEQKALRLLKNQIGCNLPSLQDLDSSRTLRQAGSITTDPSHPWHKKVYPTLLCGWKLRSVRTKTILSSSLVAWSMRPKAELTLPDL